MPAVTVGTSVMAMPVVMGMGMLVRFAVTVEMHSAKPILPVIANAVRF